MMSAGYPRKFIVNTIATFAVVYGLMIGLTGTMTLIPQVAFAQEQGNVPGNSAGNINDAELWRAIRQGVTGKVSILDKKAGILVQSDGDQFRELRNGPLSSYGGWAMFGIFIVLILFYAMRGRIQIDSGRTGRTVTRFNFLERFAHWLTASSFIVLAVTGLNTLYGKTVLMPLLGKDAFAGLAHYGKLSHNYIGFAFMIGILLMIVIWVRDNIPDRLDLNWLSVAGGLFDKNVHPPARKFNAGQKMIFWAVVVGGLSMSYTGISLLFPFEIASLSTIAAGLNMVGFDLPTDLSPLYEAQIALLSHAVVAIAMIVFIIGHIYIGSVGMDGAIEAVTTGEVDENWAREHHSLWLEELQANKKEPAE
jgi:formate dehydrogenase subunit gamma